MTTARKKLNAIGSDILAVLRDGIQLRERSPGVFQVELPAFALDGDGMQVFIRAEVGDGFTVTDLGATLARDTSRRDAIDAAAQVYGLHLVDGEIMANTKAEHLLGTVLSLIQVQTVVDDDDPCEWPKETT